jgi:membrane protease YdiL (CAAX protease family)
VLAWLLLELVLVVAVGSLATWTVIATRVYRNVDVVPFAARRPVPWGAPHLIIIVAGVLLLQSVATLVAGVEPETRIDEMSPAEKLHLTAAVGLASLLASLAGAGLLVRTAAATSDDLGLPGDWTALVSDLKLGLFGFLAAVLPVYAIQVVILLVHHGLGETPTHHPLVTMVRDDDRGGTLFVALLTAVFVAPIFEEFVFRLVFQGWFEKLAAPRVVTDRNEAAACQSPVAADAPVAEPTEDGYSWSAAGPEVRPAPMIVRPPPSWPVVGSATLFAAMHLGHGFDPIPLFFLALGLGYVYRRTHRIVPCIVMHAAFNAFSLSMLGIDIPGTTK